jgi:hypothetical protein
MSGDDPNGTAVVYFDATNAVACGDFYLDVPNPTKAKAAIRAYARWLMESRERARSWSDWTTNRETRPRPRPEQRPGTFG